jgi:hypothetical protein
VPRFTFLFMLASSLALLVSGCDGRTGSSPNAYSAAPAAPAAKSGLRFDPEALSSCETTALVKVRWNVSAQAGVKAVNVVTVRPNGEEAMFAKHVRPAGMKRTGRWIRAGRQFVVRDAKGGAELARASVGTLPCPANSDATKPGG